MTLCYKITACVQVTKYRDRKLNGTEAWYSRKDGWIPILLLFILLDYRLNSRWHEASSKLKISLKRVNSFRYSRRVWVMRLHKEEGPNHWLMGVDSQRPTIHLRVLGRTWKDWKKRLQDCSFHYFVRESDILLLLIIFTWGWNKGSTRGGRGL